MSDYLEDRLPYLEESLPFLEDGLLSKDQN